ncbi:MAG TPA: hypothetical protein PL059_03285 [Spirochaetota bacterium]|nr:hypothetical protein [Spirochaetota bacterium]
MKSYKNIIILLFSMLLLFFNINSVVYSNSEVKSIFIKPFTITKDFNSNIKNNSKSDSEENEEIVESVNDIGKDIRDYIAETIVTFQGYSIISDDDVKSLGKEVEKKMLFGNCSNEDVCAKELMRAIDTDCIIYGTVEKYNEYNDTIIIKAVLLYRDGGSIRKTLKIPRERYVEEASHALAKYLVTRKESYIKDFEEWMEEKEFELQKFEKKWERTLQAINDAYYSKLACLNHSPFLRIGYGGFPVSKYKTTYLQNENYNKYYTKLTTYIIDIFIYRYKDEVGDGIDLYSRLFYRNFIADENAYTKIKNEMQLLPPGNYDDYAGKYSPVPEDNLTMTHVGGDVGIRFVGSTYFLWEAWSFYTMFGGRFVRVEEKYISGGEKYSKLFNSFGYTCGVGMEVTLNRYMGFFGEISGGYTLIGKNDVNIDGIQLLVGVMFRTNHISGSIFGFF